MHSPLSLLPAFFLLFTSSIANPIAANPISLNLPRPFSAGDPNQFTYSQTNNSLANVPLSRNSSEEFGINCEGSAFGCIGAAGANIMHVLRDYMSVLTKYPQISYVAGQKIACKEHSLFPFIVHGYFCAFLEGQNVPTAGVHGDVLLTKMQQLIDHGCKGCGSVPLENGNDPTVMGKLTVNYVKSSECVGLCFYGSGGYIQEIRFEDDTDAGAANGIEGSSETAAAAATTPTPTETVSLSSARYIAGVTYTPGSPGYSRLAAGNLHERDDATSTTPTSASTSPSVITTPITTNVTSSPPTVTWIEVGSESHSIVSVRYIDPVTYRPGDSGWDVFADAGGNRAIQRRNEPAPSTTTTPPTTMITTTPTITPSPTTMTIQPRDVSITSVRYIPPVTYRPGDPAYELFAHANADADAGGEISELVREEEEIGLL